MHITDLVAGLVLQIGVIILAVRLFGRLAKLIKIPSVLGELLAGVIIGPFALGGIPIPFFPEGIFPLALTTHHTLAVSLELYSFATFASIVLLFVTGLETDLSMFLRYSVAGSIIGVSGALLSFATGTLASYLLLSFFGLHVESFLDPRCLMLGVVATTTSVGITARTLSERKKLDSPEGVTILSASVFDDVIWIILLAIALGIVSFTTGQASAGLSAVSILMLAGKVIGIWFGVTVLLLLCSKLLAKFLKSFKSSLEFSVLALGLALILAGLLEKQGLALIIGAYIAGLALSKTDIAAIVQDRIRALYELFVPIFFAVMGMMVDIREVTTPFVLIFGALFTLAVILSKVLGSGGTALLSGFNNKGALRIGMGMIPRGEGALITCGIGLAIGIFDIKLFSAAVFMIFLTIVISPALLGLALKIPGQGTRKPVKHHDSVREIWNFETKEIADLVVDNLLAELRNEGFYIQMNIDEGISQARKDDIAIFITEEHASIMISTAKTDMPFVKNEVYEVILDLYHNIERLKLSASPAAMKKELSDTQARTTKNIIALIDPNCLILDLKGTSKGQIISELVDLLDTNGKLLDKDLVLADVLERERTMSTGMDHGIALPHAKTDGIADTAVAIGVKKEGVNFESMDGQPSQLFVLIVSPKKDCGLYVQFLAAIGAILRDGTLRDAIINASAPTEAVELMKKFKK
ncbi:MAG: cation:proton antiporter [Treponema sp.]|nr:cation:proton antiporter [Treponema sp.]MCL2236941.1 cation:proton antiporter [Treponema sp.]